VAPAAVEIVFMALSWATRQSTDRVIPEMKEALWSATNLEKSGVLI
jgi:hypothetical protein